MSSTACRLRSPVASKAKSNGTAVVSARRQKPQLQPHVVGKCAAASPKRASRVGGHHAPRGTSTLSTASPPHRATLTRTPLPDAGSVAHDSTQDGSTDHPNAAHHRNEEEEEKVERVSRDACTRADAEDRVPARTAEVDDVCESTEVVGPSSSSSASPAVDAQADSASVFAQDGESRRPSYISVLTKRLPRSRAGAQRCSGMHSASHPDLFINIPTRTPVLDVGNDEQGRGVFVEASVHGEVESTTASRPLDHPCGSLLHSQSSAVSVVNTPARAPFGAVEVIPGLFLGSNADAANAEALHEQGVSLVLNVAAECPISSDVVKNKYGVRYIHLPLKDHSDQVIAPLFVPVAQIIHAQLHRRALYQEQQQSIPSWSVGREDHVGPSRGLDAGEACADEVSQAYTDNEAIVAEEEQSDDDGELVLLSASAVSGHPCLKETRHETPRSPLSLRAAAAAAAAGSQASSCMVSPSTAGGTVCPAIVSPSSGQRNRFAPTFPSNVEVGTAEKTELEETARVLQQLSAPAAHHGADDAASVTLAAAAGTPAVLPFRREDCGGVLVHCRMGVSRSASFVLAYLLLFGKALARLPVEGAGARWLFREGWAAEESRLLGQVLADQIDAHAHTTTTASSSGSGGTAPATARRRSGGSTGPSRHAPSPRHTNNGNTAPRAGCTEAGTASPAHAWLSPMVPLTAQMRWQLKNRSWRGGKGEYADQSFASHGSVTSPASTTASPCQLQPTADVVAVVGGSGEGEEVADGGSIGGGGGQFPENMDVTPTTGTVMSAPDGTLSCREVAMGFCEPCYRMRLAASLTFSSSAPSPTPGGRLARHSQGSLSSAVAVGAPSHTYGSPLALATGSGSPALPLTAPSSGTWLPTLSSGGTATHGSALANGQPGPRWQAGSTGSTPLGAAGAATAAARSPLLRPVHGARSPPGRPLTTTTTTTTTTVTATSNALVQRGRPQLRLEVLSPTKPPPSFSSPTSCMSASLVSAAPLRGSGMGYSEAFHFLKSKKSNVNPNIGFVLALRELAGVDDGFSLSSSLKEPSS